MQKPKLEEFGITEEQFDDIEEHSDRVVRRIAIAGILIIISACVAFVVYSILKPEAEVIGTIVNTVYILVAGTIITMLIIEGYLFRLKMTSPAYKKVCQYKLAMKDYEKQLIDESKKFGSG